MNFSYFLFVFGSVIVQLSVIIPSSKCDIIDDLKKNITKQEDIQKELKDDYAFLKKTYEETHHKYDEAISALIEEKVNASGTLDEKIQLGLDLYKILVDLRFEESLLNWTLQYEEKIKHKLDYGIKWLTQRLDILEARKVVHDDVTCFKIIDEPLNSTGRSLGNPDEVDPDEVYYYQNRLNQLLTQNFDLNLEINELNLTITKNTELWESEIANLNKVIESYLEDIETATKDNEKIKKDIEAIKEEIAHLKELVIAIEKQIEEELVNVKVLKTKLQGFARAEKCYNKVEKEVLNMVP